MVDIYIDYMTEVATNLGLKHNAKEEMKKIVDFEYKLAQVMRASSLSGYGVFICCWDRGEGGRGFCSGTVFFKTSQL